jgi:methyl-accepting chemotaxis protein
MKYIRWSTWAQKLGRRLSFLSAMSIATRLHVGFGSLLVLIAALGSLGWVQTSHLSARTEKIVSEDAKRASLANDLQIAVQQMVIALGSLSTRSDMEDRKFYNGQFETAVTAFTSAKAEMKKLDVPNEAPIWLESMRKVEEIDVEAIRIFKDVAKAATEGDSSPASMQRLYDEQVAGPAATLIEALGGLRGAMSQSMLAAAARSKEQASRTQLGSALMVALALVGGIIASTLIARGISRPMTQAVLLAKAVATGLGCELWWVRSAAARIPFNRRVPMSPRETQIFHIARSEPQPIFRRRPLPSRSSPGRQNKVPRLPG